MKKITVEMIQKTAFEFFMSHTNLDNQTSGYGLTVDHSKRLELASIASTGFMLSALVIGAEHGYIEREKALEIARGTLKTLSQVVPHFHGFFAHFLDITTGERHKKCEYSTIDTALALCGILTVDQYFNDEDVSKLAKEIFDRIDWSLLVHEREGRQLLYMAYNPDRGGDYVEKKPGFIHQWDMFAEQLMMYVMIAGSKDSAYAYDLYQGFERQVGTYHGYSYIFSPGNSLFVYQFPLAWLDLKDIVDEEGINWFENAKIATQAHHQAAIDHSHLFKTLSDAFFGFSASDTPKGYRVHGGLPNSMGKLDTDGTIAPFAAIGSLPMTPDLSLHAIDHMAEIEGLWGPYGFYDGFNFEEETPWLSERYHAINKGLELLMANAYLSQDVHHAFMNHPIIRQGMEVLKWRKK